MDTGYFKADNLSPDSRVSHFVSHFPQPGLHIVTYTVCSYAECRQREAEETPCSTTGGTTTCGLLPDTELVGNMDNETFRSVIYKHLPT